jgi:hypothetical protein
MKTPYSGKNLSKNTRIVHTRAKQHCQKLCPKISRMSHHVLSNFRFHSRAMGQMNAMMNSVMGDAFGDMMGGMGGFPSLLGGPMMMGPMAGGQLMQQQHRRSMPGMLPSPFSMLQGMQPNGVRPLFKCVHILLRFKTLLLLEKYEFSGYIYHSYCYCQGSLLDWLDCCNFSIFILAIDHL